MQLYHRKRSLSTELKEFFSDNNGLESTVRERDPRRDHRVVKSFFFRQTVVCILRTSAWSVTKDYWAMIIELPMFVAEALAGQRHILFLRGVLRKVWVRTVQSAKRNFDVYVQELWIGKPFLRIFPMMGDSPCMPQVSSGLIWHATLNSRFFAKLAPVRMSLLHYMQHVTPSNVFSNSHLGNGCHCLFVREIQSVLRNLTVVWESTLWLWKTGEGRRKTRMHFNLLKCLPTSPFLVSFVSWLDA